MKILLVNKYWNCYGGQEVMVEQLALLLTKYHRLFLMAKRDVASGSATAIRGPEKIFYGIRDFKKSQELAQVFHFHNPFHFFTLKAIFLLRGKNKICSFHSRAYASIFWKRILLLLKERLVLLAVPFFIDKFIYKNNFDKDYFESRMLIRRPGKIIEGGVESDFFGVPRELILERRLKILFVGRLTTSKGLLDILNLAALMPELDFELVGEGEELDFSKFSNVFYRGRLKRRRLPEIYKAADVFLLPSYSECFPAVTMLEAMASGLPVVAYDVGGSSEEIKNGINGFLATKGDWRSLIDILRRIVSDPTLYKSISLNNIKTIEAKNSLSKFLKQHLDFYNG